MARLAGIAGGLSGKVGSMVFRQRQGETIATQYQPVVTNPNTDAQQDSRVAFKLMSQLASIMAPAMGSFIIKVRKEGKGRPSQRNAFFQENYGLVTTTDTENGKRAAIPMEQLKLTNSFVAAGTITVENSQDGITIIGAGSPAARVKIVVVGYNPTAAGDAPARIVTILEEQVKADGDYSVTIPSTEFEKKGVGENITILSYGLIPLSQRMRTKMENITTPSNEPFFSAVELTKAVQDGEMSVTETIGANFTAGQA